MKKFIICLCLFSAIKADAQNLVLNPSFEDTIACTGTYAMPCNYWYWATYGSPDYFSEQPDINCVVPAPQSTAGFQYARTGIAYVGLGLFTQHIIPTFINKREYVGGILLDTLRQGHEYCVSFYVSVAEEFKYVTDGMGLYLSVDSAVDYTINTNLSFVPQISNPAGNIIYDTLNWVQISGTYIANGGEKYFTIGNFKDDANTMIDSTSSTGNSAYYFIDDVSVIDCTVGISEVNDNLNSGKLYPNPARTAVYYESELNDNENGLLELYDMLGNKLSAYKLNHGKNKITIGTSGYARGVYMVKVNVTDRQPEFIKLVLQ
jgi:OOP family OmpA-OmpF porin